MINTCLDLSLNLFRSSKEFFSSLWRLHKNLFYRVKKTIVLENCRHFFLTSTEECVSLRNANPAGMLKFLKYSNDFNLFSEALIPLKLSDENYNLSLNMQYSVIY